jgi:hypothetical protein
MLSPASFEDPTTDELEMFFALASFVVTALPLYIYPALRKEARADFLSSLSVTPTAASL